MKTEKIKAYKAFDKDFRCHDFQYEVGKTYHHKGTVELCESGFHACTNPLDVLNYYDLTNCRFAEVELWGCTKETRDDSKRVGAHIKIVRELTLSEFIDVVNVVLAEPGDDSKLAASGNYSKLAEPGDDSKLAASGNYSKLAASGYDAQLAASGYRSRLAASGNYSKLAASGNGSNLAASGNCSNLAASGNGSNLAASGYCSNLAASGNYSKLAASGYDAQLAASGDYSQLAASGNDSQLAVSGDEAQLEITGEHSVGANIGANCKIKGIVGTWITLAEYVDGVCVCVRSAQIDGAILKADTWYQLINGEFTEVKD